MNTITESLTSFDAKPGIPAAALASSAYEFRGRKLWPCDSGTMLLVLQSSSAEDLLLFAWHAFLFIHVQRGTADNFCDDRPELFTLCWDQTKFRQAVLAWMNEIGARADAEGGDAKRLYERMLADHAAADGSSAQQQKRRKRR
jgi:hypothetical protein